MRRRSFAIAVGFVLAGSLVSASGASAKVATFASFQVEGSKGYDVSVSGSTGAPQVTLSAFDKNGSATYTTKGKVTSDSIKAKFKGLGEIDVEFDPKGKPETTGPPKGCTGPDTVSQQGTWKGKISFKGENGFTKVSEKKAKGGTFKPKGKGVLDCSGGGGGNPQPKQCLSISTQIDGGSFSAQKVDGKEPTFNAFVNGDKNGISISRSVSAEGGTLTGNADTQAATVAPPAPFSGTGTVTDGVLSGNLSVKFPGDTANISGDTFVSEGKFCF